MNKTTLSDKQLWQQCRQSNHLSTKTHLDSTTLAGYLDGSLSKTARTQVEQHFNQCSDCLAYIVELKDITPSPVSNELLISAKALVHHKVNDTKPWLHTWLIGMGWASSCCAILFVAVAGFNLGAASFTHESQVEEFYINELSFGLSESLAIWEEQ